MTEREVVDLFKRLGVLVDGHFTLSSGRHARLYVEKRMLFPHPIAVSLLCKEIANQFYRHGIGTVVGPEAGGIILSHEVASHLSRDMEYRVYAVSAERREWDKFRIRPIHEQFVRDRDVLVVEDTITSGKSVRGTIAAVEQCGGRVTAVGALWNREHATAESLGVRHFHALTEQYIPSWEAGVESCPLCRDGIPLTPPPGHE